MKKHRGLKITVLLACVCIIMGSILLGAGFVSGGSLRYLNVNSETVSWWPFPFGSVGIHVWNDNEDYLKEHQEIFDEQQLREINSLDIKADAADIKIYRGSVNRAYFNGDKESLDIQLYDEKLSIRIDHKRVLGKVSGTLVVELKDKIYDNIRVDCSLGQVKMDDIRTGELDIKANLGNIEIEGIYSEKTNLDADCGQIKVEGTLLGKSDIKNNMGNTEVSIEGDFDMYSYQVKNNLGNTEVMGSKHRGNANLTGGNQSAPNRIHINSSVGNVELEFD